METKVYYKKKYSKSEVLDLISLAFDNFRDGFSDMFKYNKSSSKSIELSHIFEIILLEELIDIFNNGGDIND